MQKACVPCTQRSIRADGPPHHDARALEHKLLPSSNIYQGRRQPPRHEGTHVVGIQPRIGLLRLRWTVDLRLETTLSLLGSVRVDIMLLARSIC